MTIDVKDGGKALLADRKARVVSGSKAYDHIPSLTGPPIIEGLTGSMSRLPLKNLYEAGVVNQKNNMSSS
jgi:hypothetical protein